LSSYTWICLALNFLQTRDPPVLPSLQMVPGLQPRVLNGVNVAFESDISKFNNYGSRNTSSLGDLLYQFFRYYAHEFDFDDNVVSVRLGGLMPKSTKGWQLLQDNRLCVEEPFNTGRNLANTADDTSMRGIHLELRRAFNLIVEGKLNLCCEQYEYPAEEVRPSEHFVPPQSRPVIPQPPQPQPPRNNKTSRAAKNGGSFKNAGGRRSSNPVARQQVYLRNLPFQMTTQELQSQALHQQHLLHDQLFQQYQYLQLQEQELRARLNEQNIRQQTLIAAQQHQRRGNHPTSTLYGNQEDNMESVPVMGFSAQHRGPLSAPLYQPRFGVPSPFFPPPLPVNGVATNPSSPHLTPATPDSRRYSRRTSVGQSLAGTSLRAQSQPARGLVSSVSMSHLQPAPEMPEYPGSRRSSASGTTHDSGPTYSSQRSQGFYDPHRKPAEYVGYYVGQSPSLYGYPASTTISPIPSQAGLAIQDGGLSPHVATRSPFASSNATRTTSPVKEAIARTQSRESNSPARRQFTAGKDKAESPPHRSAPLIVDGSVHSPQRRRQNGTREEGDEAVTFSASTSEDLAFDTPSSSDEHSHDADSTVIPNGVKAQTGKHSLAKHLAKGLSGVQHKVVMNGIDHSPRVNGQKPWTLPRQLSAVQEARTPSPALASPVKKGDVLSKDNAASPLAPVPAQDTELAIRTNGAATSQPTNPSSWQTPNRKKHRKKKVKSENDIGLVNGAGGELAPADVTQRKGG
jgi:hypothetical protein